MLKKGVSMKSCLIPICRYLSWSFRKMHMKLGFTVQPPPQICSSILCNGYLMQNVLTFLRADGNPGFSALRHMPSSLGYGNKFPFMLSPSSLKNLLFLAWLLSSSAFERGVVSASGGALDASIWFQAWMSIQASNSHLRLANPFIYLCLNVLAFSTGSSHWLMKI